MIETRFNKVYPSDKLTKKKERFRRSTIVYNFINYIVKKIYLINDDIDDHKKTE